MSEISFSQVDIVEEKELDADLVDLPPHIKTDPLTDTPVRYIPIIARLRTLRSTCRANPDTICFTLHGTITTQIGDRKATKKILVTSTHCRVSDLNKSTDCSKASRGRGSVVLTAYLNLGVPSRLPSTTTLSGSRYITKHTALSDQHLVKGRCDIRYWVTTDIDDTRGDERQLQAPYPVSTPLELRLPSSFICIEATRGIAHSQTCYGSKAGYNYISARCGFLRAMSRHTAQLIFDVPELSSIPIASGQSFKLPVNLTVTLPRPVSSKETLRNTLTRHHLLRQGLRELVFATIQWQTATCFSVGSRHPDHSIRSAVKYAVTSGLVVDFPPFYPVAGNNFNSESYAATAVIELTLPNAVLSGCSYDSELFRRSHTLHLELITKKLEIGSMLVLPQTSATLDVKCMLS